MVACKDVKCDVEVCPKGYTNKNPCPVLKYAAFMQLKGTIGKKYLHR